MFAKRLEEVVAMVDGVLVCLLNSFHRLGHPHCALYQAEHQVGEQGYSGYADNACI